MKDKKRVTITIIFLLAAAGIIILLSYLNSVRSYKEKVAATQIKDIDISKVPDGTYTGDYNVDFIYAKVEVTVKDGTITGIKLLKHKSDRGKPAEKIIDDVVKQQSLNVDAVSGATNSSIVIKKAIENALSNQAEEK